MTSPGPSSGRFFATSVSPTSGSLSPKGSISEGPRSRGGSGALAADDAASAHFFDAVSGSVAHVNFGAAAAASARELDPEEIFGTSSCSPPSAPSTQSTPQTRYRSLATPSFTTAAWASPVYSASPRRAGSHGFDDGEFDRSPGRRGAGLSASAGAEVLRVEPPEDAAELRRLVALIYTLRAPEKLSSLASILAKYAGAEAVLLEFLQKKYNVSDDELQQIAASSPPPPFLREGRVASLGEQRPELVNVDARALQRRIERLYSRYHPAKLVQLSAILNRYAGAEDLLLEHLIKKYGPEPPP